jgi:hypothetical protein
VLHKPAATGAGSRSQVAMATMMAQAATVIARATGIPVPSAVLAAAGSTTIELQAICKPLRTRKVGCAGY